MTKKILLIEDEADLLMVTKTRLESTGYTIITARSGEEALSILKRIKPDLIILDLILPNMQGDVLCKKLKTTHAFRHIPIIIFTAKPLHVPEAIQAMGADDYITKPFETKDMLQKIKNKIG